MIFRKSYLDLLVLAVFAFAGGFITNHYLVSPGYAQGRFNASYYLFRIVDKLNPAGIQMYVNGGAPTVTFYDVDGGARTQNGIYPVDPAYPPRMADLPFITLSDRKGNVRLVLHLDGSGTNNAPVITMIDSKQKDRLVLGLALTSDNEDSFLSLFDGKGRQKDIIDEYRESLEPDEDQEEYGYGWQ